MKHYSKELGKALKLSQTRLKKGFAYYTRLAQHFRREDTERR